MAALVHDYYEPHFQDAVNFLRTQSVDWSVAVPTFYGQTEVGLVGFVNIVQMSWTAVVSAYEHFVSKQGAHLAATWVGVILGHLDNVRDVVIPGIVNAGRGVNETGRALAALKKDARSFRPTVHHVSRVAAQWNQKDALNEYSDMMEFLSDTIT